MDANSWINTLGLFVQPAVAGAAFWFVWRLRTEWAKDTIAAKEAQLQLARDQLGDVKSKLDNALQQVADQGKEIAELRQTRVEAAKVDRLVQSNTAIREDLNVVMTSTSVLSQTLNVGHLVGVAPIPAGPSITKRSG